MPTNMKELDEKAIPVWLMALSEEAIEEGELPLEKLLQGSLYYPAAGFDGRPVQLLAEKIHSFVYVDYDKSKSELLEELGSREYGFKGYRVLALRDVSMGDLVPNGWRPEVLPGPNENPQTDSVPGNKPYCMWVILERTHVYGEAHGPARFSLLYLCADGAAAYQALYNANGFIPKALAIIQPGTGFGGNYTDFRDPVGILARSVYGNRHGMPEFLLNGGIGNRDSYSKSIWPGYQTDCGWLDPWNIKIWSKNETA